MSTLGTTQKECVARLRRIDVCALSDALDKLGRAAEARDARAKAKAINPREDDPNPALDDWQSARP